MAILNILALCPQDDVAELTQLGILGPVGALDPLIASNPKFLADNEIRSGDIDVQIAYFDANSGALLGAPPLDADLDERRVDGIMFILGRAGSLGTGKMELVSSRQTSFARARVPIMVLGVHGGLHDYELWLRSVSDVVFYTEAPVGTAGSGGPLSVLQLSHIQDRVREHLKSMLRHKRAPSVAIGALIVAADTRRLFLGKKRRGVGIGEWATVGGNLRAEGALDATLEKLIAKRLETTPCKVGPLLACTVMTRLTVRFVDLTFLVVVQSESSVKPDADEYQEHKWLTEHDAADFLVQDQIFEPVANSMVKYLSLRRVDGLMSALAPFTSSLQQQLGVRTETELLLSGFPHFRSPYYFESD